MWFNGLHFVYVSVHHCSVFITLFSIGNNDSANLHPQHILRKQLQKFFDFLAFKIVWNNSKMKDVHEKNL